MKFIVNVPATTANLGPGFDCLGLALDWWNSIAVAPAKSLIPVLRGNREGLAADASNLTIQSMLLLYKQIGKQIPPVKVTMTNRFPIGRGFGSSAAALVGGLVAANALAGTPLTAQELVELANEAEGHPDNVSAAIFGGMTISAMDGPRLVVASITPPPLWRAVVFVPQDILSTQYARKVLPPKVSRADAVYNLGRAALLVYAFSTGRPGFMEIGTQDRLHQPYRESLVKGMPEMLQAARTAGAAGAALVGAGPTLIAFAASQSQAADTARSFRKTAGKLGIKGNSRILKPSPRGAYIVNQQ